MKSARKKEIAELLSKVASLLKEAATKEASYTQSPKFAIDLRALRELVDNGQQRARWKPEEAGGADPGTRRKKWRGKDGRAGNNYARSSARTGLHALLRLLTCFCNFEITDRIKSIPSRIHVCNPYFITSQQVCINQHSIVFCCYKLHTRFCRTLQNKICNKIAKQILMQVSVNVINNIYKTVIFIDGCFWHGHDGCKYYQLPKTNVDFWRHKITMNIARDYSNNVDLKLAGWHVIRIWECEIKTKAKRKNTLEALYFNIISKNNGFIF